METGANKDVIDAETLDNDKREEMKTLKTVAKAKEDTAKTDKPHPGGCKSKQQGKQEPTPATNAASEKDGKRKLSSIVLLLSSSAWLFLKFCSSA